jgi:hypothetical protein
MLAVGCVVVATNLPGAIPIKRAAAAGDTTVTAMVTAIPSGGELYTYDFPNGEVQTVPVPPESFQPLTASSQALATYDFPASGPSRN